MRVNIWLVIILVVFEVSLSMAARSVEAALEKQLNKKGYAVLQLKKKRLVLRNTDVDKHRHQSNGLHKNTKVQYDSIPADTALRSKYIDTNTMRKLARTNLSHFNRFRRHEHEQNEELEEAEKDDLEAVQKSLYAEANAIASAVESEEVRQDVDSEAGNTAEDNKESQSKAVDVHKSEQSNAVDDYGSSDDKGNADNEEYTDKHNEKVKSDYWKKDGEENADENHSKKELSGNSHDKNHEKVKKSSHGEKSKCDMNELTKEVGTVFDLLAKGEKNLMEQMEHLKSSIGKSIGTLKTIETDMVVKRKRRDALASKAFSDVMKSLTKEDIAKYLARSKRENLNEPARACIFIDAPVASHTPSEHTAHHFNHLPQVGVQAVNNGHTVVWKSNSAEEQSGHPHYEKISTQSENGYANENSYAGGQRGDFSNYQANVHEAHGKSSEHLTNEDVNHEHFQSSISHTAYNEHDNNQLSGNDQQSMEESIDLHSIYWLKLPKEYNDDFDQKVYSLLKGISQSGRDILIIPVTRSYSNNDEITEGFLRAVRVSPTSRRAQYFKRVKKFNIRLIK